MALPSLTLLAFVSPSLILDTSFSGQLPFPLPLYGLLELLLQLSSPLLQFRESDIDRDGGGVEDAEVGRDDDDNNGESTFITLRLEWRLEPFNVE